jgi:hypothetical protein
LTVLRRSKKSGLRTRRFAATNAEPTAATRKNIATVRLRGVRGLVLRASVVVMR